VKSQNEYQKRSVGRAFFALFICRRSIVSRFDTLTLEASEASYRATVWADFAYERIPIFGGVNCIWSFVHSFIHRRYFLSIFENTWDTPCSTISPMKKHSRAGEMK